MARMPGVGFHSVPHFNRGRASAVNLVIVHQFAGGTVAAVQNWLRNPASRVSYHFGVGRNGEIRQWVDTADTAWATGPANARSIAIGHEATNQPLTEAQLNATARIIRWARGAHRGIPSGAGGIGWHRQFMQTNCPGDPIIRQVPELQRRSTASAPAPPPPPPARGPRWLYAEDSMQLVFADHPGGAPRAAVAIGNQWNRDGNTRVRFHCAQDTALRVWTGQGATIRISTGPLSPNGFNIPRGVSAFIVLRDGGGTAPVDMALSRNP